jgi:hypothetical protein
MIRSHSCPPKPTPCRWCRANVPVTLAVAPTGAKRGACRHLGADTGGRRLCDSCGGRVELKVMACGVHGMCTAGKRVDGVACCTGCPDWEAK